MMRESKHDKSGVGLIFVFLVVIIAIISIVRLYIDKCNQNRKNMTNVTVSGSRFEIYSEVHDGYGYYIVKDTKTGVEYLTTDHSGGIIELKKVKDIIGKKGRDEY